MPRRLKTAQEKKQFREYLEAAFSSRSVQTIRHYLSGLAVPLPFRLRMKVVYAPSGVLESFDALAGNGELLRLSDTAPGFRLTGSIGRDVIRHVSVPFAVLPTAEKKVRAIVAVAERDEWRFLTGYVRSQYPRLVPVYLSQRELIDGVQRLRDTADDFAVRVKEITAKEALGPAQRAKSVREWTDEALQEVLTHVVDRRQVLTSIRLGFYRKIGERVDVTPTASTKVWKQGEVGVSGQFLLAWNTVVEHVAATGAKKLAFFSNRGLRARQYKAAPLQIRFSRPVFQETEDVRQLVGVLESYPHSMHSVQHGNPYIHLRISDTYDGSAFDVWAVSDDAMVLVPRLKSSEAAVERLIHYVFDMFREGEILEFQDDRSGA